MNSDTPGSRADGGSICDGHGPPLQGEWDGELTAARLALLLGALLLVSYPDILACTHAFFYRDTGQFGFPVAWYLRDCFWRGEVPLWNPYNNCGIPFLAQWNTLAVYPLSLFYELAPMPWGMNFFILGHVFLAAIGMYFLALRWFGNRFAASFAGLMFAWNGLALNCWMWPCHIAALGWMPWVVLLAERAWNDRCASNLNPNLNLEFQTNMLSSVAKRRRREISVEPCQEKPKSPVRATSLHTEYAAPERSLRVFLGRVLQRCRAYGALRRTNRPVLFAALAGACQMMTGSPEIIIFTWLIVAGVFAAGALSQKRISWGGAGRLAAVAALVTALSAAQLLPWLDLLAHGDRTSAAGDNTWAMPVWGAANFLVPLFRMSGSVTGVFMQPGQEWTTSYYAGILTLLLAALAVLKVRNARTAFLGLLAVGGVLFAMGDSGLLLRILKMLVPAMGLTRFPIKFVVLTNFSLPLLAAAGIVCLQGRAALGVRRALLVLGGAIAVAVAALAFCVPFAEDSRSVVGANGVARLLVLAAGLGVIFYQPRFKRKAGQLVFSFALLFLSGLDICTHVPRQNPTVPVRDYAALTPPGSAVPRLGESRAMPGRAVQNLMIGLANPDPEQLYLGQRKMLFSDCNLLEKIPKVNGFFSIHLREEAAVAGLLYGETPLPRLEEFLGVSLYSPELFVWETRTNFIPWATIGQQPVFLDDKATLAALARPDFAPREVVYLPAAERAEVSAKADPRARIVSSTIMAEKCAFQTEADTRTMLVVAQGWYHCWQASVDGMAVPLLRANGGLQAVEVPAGSHQVRLEYKDHAFQLGCVISAVALLFCAVTIFSKTSNSARPGGV
jgi:hypothetical protein